MLKLVLRGVRNNVGRYLATLVAIITGVGFFTATGFLSDRVIDASRATSTASTATSTSPSCSTTTATADETAADPETCKVSGSRPSTRSSRCRASRAAPAC